VVWAAIAWLQRREAGVTRLQRVVAGTIVIAIIGVVIDQAFVIRANMLDQSPDEYEQAVAGLLRYYWYRMSDSLVPVGVALAAVWGIAKLQTSKPALAAWLSMAAILLSLANLAEVHYQRRRLPIPPAIVQPNIESTRPISAKKWWQDWQAVCDWVEQETPADALFLTPREQQTFKWYAGRPEIATRKDVPQDARGLMKWKQRLEDIYPRDTDHNLHDLAAFSDAELLDLARKYGASYIVVDLTRAQRRIGLPKLYPEFARENASFAVYRVPEPTAP
jgi:hypothetical protein